MNRLAVWMFLLSLIVSPAIGQEGVYSGVSEASPTGSTAISLDALVSAFDMESRTSDGRLRDFGPAGNHGEISGTVLVDGRHGLATQFQTASDRIHLVENPTLDLNGPLTIALRIRVQTLDLHQHVFACDDKYVIWITPQNQIRFSDTLGSGYDSSSILETDVWYSVVATTSASRGAALTRENTRIYINGENATGQLVNRGRSEPPRWQPGSLYESDACYIGFESHQGMESHKTLQLEAEIDDLLLFGRALTEEEINVYSGR